MKKRFNPKIWFTKIVEKIKAQQISLRFLLLDSLLLLVIVTLSFNIFLAYRDGVENLGRLKIEEEKLLKLQEENERLSEEENYYKSIEFRKAYARDSLNLTNEGETLYMVVRNEADETSEQGLKLFNPQELNSVEFWKLLIFGS